jgi:hypothetical protein
MSVLERLKQKPVNLNTNYRFPINIPILAELDFTEETFLEFVKKLEGITAVEPKELKQKKVSAVKAKMVMLEEEEGEGEEDSSSKGSDIGARLEDDEARVKALESGLDADLEEVAIEKQLKEKSARKRAIKGISTLKPQDWAPIEGKSIKTLAEKEEPVRIKASKYYMNNREKFINFINSKFSHFKKELADNAENISCDNQSSGEFSLLIHQQLVRDYLNLYTPYRGLLLYHGLGSGKTCTSIAIAEGMKNAKKVFIMTPASLEQNYLSELKKCGDEIYKKNQHWDWIPLPSSNVEIETLSAALQLPVDYIKKGRGVFLVDKTKTVSNYQYLGIEDKNKLDDQINEMIKAKYTFIHYNGLRRAKLSQITNNFETNIFDNSVIIIDEAHNFISRIVNKIDKEKPIPFDKKGKQVMTAIAMSLILYEMLLTAQNARVILLTGTPMINYPNELGILFNILRGYIYTWEISLDVKPGQSINKEMLHDLLIKNKNMDYMDYSNKKLFITRNPFGFESSFTSSSGTYAGVSNELEKRSKTKGEKVVVPVEHMSNEDFERNIMRTLHSAGIETVTGPNSVIIHPYKCLPDKLEEFVQWFISEDKTIKNPDIFKRRIMGMTSYFRSAQEQLLPKYDVAENFNIVSIPMSDYQFDVYELARYLERKQEKGKPAAAPKPGEIYTEPSSTYRIFSRLYCNFVMPPEVPRPMPKEELNMEENEDAIIKTDKGKEVVAKDSDDLENFDDPEYAVEEAALEKQGDSTYVKRIMSAIQLLKDNSSTYFSEKGLQKYSPKYLEMLTNITDPTHIGLHLVYSQFRTLEGIGIFQMVLDYHGFTQFKIKQNSQGQWELDIAPENRGKPTYALYTGTESREEKEAVRNIYNGDWEAQDLSPALVEELKDISPNNNLGEIIKIFMITASGSEGINLRNTRYVHVMEPYWHPVRTEQVIGRARRICSHKGLPRELQTVEVFIYLMKFTEEQIASDKSIELKRKDLSKLEYLVSPDSTDKAKIPFTSDQALFEISVIKERISNQLLKNIKEASIDCATYSVGNTKEKLKCLTFGNPDSSSFSFNPNIAADNAGVVGQSNKKLITWKAKKITLKEGTKKIEYAYKAIDENTGEIYDLDSYTQALRTPGLEPTLIGTLNLKTKKVDYIK